MFERLNTPDEAFNFKLGATLKMERKVLDILDSAIVAEFSFSSPLDCWTGRGVDQKG
jgi:hypothetical protein